MDLREIVSALQARKISPAEAKVLIELLESPNEAAQAPPPAPAVNAGPRPAPTTALLEEEICASLAEVLYLQRSDVDPRKPFVDLGLDSVIAVEWARALNKRYGIALPATRIYDYPTVLELSAYLKTQIAAGRSGDAELNAHSCGYPELPEGGYGLVVSSARSPQELVLSPWSIPEPASGEVTIAVEASAVNFPDALCVQGLYPTLPDYPFVPGFEVAGTILKLGPDVTDLSVGDEVIAVTGMQLGGHASRVNVAAVNVIRKPASVSFEEACAIPIAFSTVNYAFEVAELAPGESVLIQTASGGCGLAAIQLARLRGCLCYATAGRPEKLDVLRRIGIDEPINYKTGRFDLEIRRMTRGRGVDAVLNMLAGQAIQQGLDCLAPFGRYLELAVHALRGGTQLDLSRLVQNQSFHSIDLRRLSVPKWRDWRSSLEAAVALAESNRIASIVSRIFPVRQAHEALRFVAEGRHIGKVVISHRATQVVDRTEQCLQGIEAQRLRSAEERSCVERTHSIPPPPAATSQVTQAAEGIAVIGMAGQFPGARSTAELWNNIVSKRDSIAEVPHERWPIEWFYDPDASQPGKTYSKWVGALQDIDCFDAAFFSIAPSEAKWMDPQQRLFLQSCWHCIEDAAIDPHSLAGSRCGVFVGCAQGDYDQLGAASGQVAESLTGGTTSILSARFSYFLNLKGPCVAIDTACSSALVAIAQACDSLILGGSDLALAGGVYVRVGPGMHVMTSKAGMLSRQGRCHTFDNRADGFVPGEGVGVFLLKRHADAIRDGDPIHAVIRGWGVNHDGRTNGITAPSAASQTLLEKDVYARFQIDPRTISLVEAHGTATKLGDPIEVEALTEAFRSYTDRKGFCALGSVKSNVGHLMIAAAVPAVVKAVLALQHRTLPPTLHFETPNEHVDFQNSPFYVNTEPRHWKHDAGSRRRAAVSSFGFSGTNAHIVLEEHCPDLREEAVHAHEAGGAPALIVLSARTGARLAAQTGQLLSVLDAGAITDAGLANAAYTLQVGRAAFEHRLALAVTSVEELRSKLTLYLAGEEVPGLYRGEVSRRVASEQLSAASVTSYGTSDAQDVLQLWVQGGAVDWERIRQGQTPRPRRIRVPLYPFASERHWHSASAEAGAGAGAGAGAKMVQPLPPAPTPTPTPTTNVAAAPDPNAAIGAIASPPPPDRAGFVAPRTDLERVIAGIWEEVLELPCVGVEDSFLELGGHSLNGVHVIKRIREEFGVELPMGALIDAHSTVAALAVVLVSELASHADAQALGEQLQTMESA